MVSSFPFLSLSLFVQDATQFNRSLVGQSEPYSLSLVPLAPSHSVRSRISVALYSTPVLRSSPGNTAPREMTPIFRFVSSTSSFIFVSEKVETMLKSSISDIPASEQSRWKRTIEMTPTFCVYVSSRSVSSILAKKYRIFNKEFSISFFLLQTIYVILVLLMQTIYVCIVVFHPILEHLQGFFRHCRPFSPFPFLCQPPYLREFFLNFLLVGLILITIQLRSQYPTKQRSS